MAETTVHNGEIIDVNLDTPEVYKGWITDVLNSHQATERISRIKLVLNQVEFLKADDVLNDLGLTENITEILVRLRQELIDHTQETTRELNLAMKKYKAELPEFYIQTIQDGPWQLVEGFTASADAVINPVVMGEGFSGEIMGIRLLGVAESE